MTADSAITAAPKITPGASVVLGDAHAEAEDLSAYDPDGSLPDLEPTDGELDPSRGTISIERRTGKLAQIEQWREQATREGLSIRELALRVSPTRPPFVGTASEIADEWVRHVRNRAADGLNLLPHPIPSSLTDVVDKLVPELQEPGAYRTAHRGTTLREHLDLPAPGPPRPAGPVPVTALAG